MRLRFGSHGSSGNDKQIIYNSIRPVTSVPLSLCLTLKNPREAIAFGFANRARPVESFLIWRIPKVVLARS